MLARLALGALTIVALAVSFAPTSTAEGWDGCTAGINTDPDDIGFQFGGCDLRDLDLQDCIPDVPPLPKPEVSGIVGNVVDTIQNLGPH